MRAQHVGQMEVLGRCKRVGRLAEEQPYPRGAYEPERAKVVHLDHLLDLEIICEIGEVQAPRVIDERTIGAQLERGWRLWPWQEPADRAERGAAAMYGARDVQQSCDKRAPRDHVVVEDKHEARGRPKGELEPPKVFEVVLRLEDGDARVVVRQRRFASRRSHWRRKEANPDVRHWHRLREQRVQLPAESVAHPMIEDHGDRGILRRLLAA